MDRNEIDRDALVALLLRPGQVHAQPSVKLSATRWIAAEEWDRLKPHEREFVRAYATGVSARSGAVVGLSSARLHLMWVLPQKNPLVELVTPNSKPPSRSQWPDGVMYRREIIPDMDLTRVHGTIVFTTPARTAVDIARWHGVRAGVVALDSLLSEMPTAEHTAFRRLVHATTQRLTGCRGIQHARQALKWSSHLSESPGESIFRTACLERGIVLQEQMWIGPDTRVDFLDDHDIVIEIDGGVKHDADPKKSALEQLQRENWVRETRRHVIRFTANEAMRDVDRCVDHYLAFKENAPYLGQPTVEADVFRPSFGPTWRTNQAG